MDINNLLKAFNLSTRESIEEAMDLIMSKEIQIMNSLENNSLTDEVSSNLLKDKEVLAAKYYELSSLLDDLTKDLPEEPETGDVED